MIASKCLLAPVAVSIEFARFSTVSAMPVLVSAISEAVSAMSDFAS
ncbi:hypothetical protein [Megamonas sp.]|nr:hypothetical protein [Megamonas sp.]